MERIVLASPRGFCAGVSYAIEVLDLAIKAYGTPLYMRHAIVHNEHVVRSFERRGVIFVEQISEIPPGSTVVFSAHGVSPAVRQEAAERNLRVIDATCPLVSKVHREVQRFASQGYHIIYIGHAGHVEALGTMGHAPNQITLVQTVEEAERVQVPEGKLAVATQTTLSVDEVERIMAVLRRRFPHLETPPKEDICYATTNRQNAVKALAQLCDLILVVGSRTSSNSNRLREVAVEAGVPAYLLLDPQEVLPEWRTDYRSVGITSGASTPEESVEAIIGELLKGQEHVPVQMLETVQEDITFLPPRTLIAMAGVSHQK
ncbi:MAG: 4-hydroxy-3-methylbut-2-enyl diphosphate reductase [Armatimonadota bacterium]|nr:4-hydroxy-3-methylbut-2-enyl diphosphate reductase [bacterium]MDW8319892.1 4-hydroxy-3-methylbut-2-enyl diphosphate reductase [Armatimonadota bacterium]